MSGHFTDLASHGHESDLATDLANVGGVPLPQALLTIGKGAVYIGQASSLTLSGSDVTAWENDHNPGTHDLSGSVAPPLWISDGGDDSTGSVQFDGSAEYMEVTDFTWALGDRPSVLGVLQYDSVTDLNVRPVGIQTNNVSTKYVRAARIRTTGANDYFGQEAYLTTDGGVEEQFGTPEASADTTLSLHEAHCFSAGFTGAWNGTESVNAGTNAIDDTYDQLILGAVDNAGPTGFAPVQICEAVVCGTSSAEVSAYRAQRVASVYPTVGAKLP